MAEKIALIGCGVMGQAIGGRLAETGNDLVVFDLDEAKVAALVAKGARRPPMACPITPHPIRAIFSAISPSQTRSDAAIDKQRMAVHESRGVG